MSISSLNSDYGKTWGRGSKEYQASQNARTTSTPTTTRRTPSSGGSSGGGGSSNAMTAAGAAAFIAAIQAATAAGYSPSNPAPASVADRYTQQANRDTGYSGSYTPPSQLASRDKDDDSVYSSLLPAALDKSNTATAAQPEQTANPKRYYVDDQGNIKAGQITDMSKWYNDFKAQSGAKPAADDVRGAMGSYRDYVAGKTNDSGNVWDNYGEQIGKSADGKGYTDFSYQAANAIPDSNRLWNRNDASTQRYLTSTPLTGDYLNYDTNQWEQAPEALQKGGPGFMDYSTLNQKAQNWLQNNPGSLWDEQSLADIWKTKYGDVSLIPSMMQKYSNEFGGPTPNLPIADAYNFNTASLGEKNINAAPLQDIIGKTATVPDEKTNDPVYEYNDVPAPTVPSPTIEWPTADVTRPADPAYYQVGAVTDSETLLRQQYGDAYVDALPVWQKQAILNSINKLKGGA